MQNIGLSIATNMQSQPRKDVSKFVLSRATEHDIAEIVELQYRSFESRLVKELLMGCSSPEDLPKFIAKRIQTTKEDPSDIWIKVIDSTTLKIVAASNWKLYLGPATAIPRGSMEVPQWLAGKQAEEAHALLDPMNEARNMANTEPFLREQQRLMSLRSTADKNQI